MKTLSSFLLICLLSMYGCSSPSEKKSSDEGLAEDDAKTTEAQTQTALDGTENFTFTIVPEQVNYKLPALHSFADAVYNDLWIVIGGQTVGFHGTSNNPPPFYSSFANDTMWVIDHNNGVSYGVPIPSVYWNALSASNLQAYQVDDKLYVCGGYTVSDPTQTRFNTTSNYFFEIDLPNFVSYVMNGGTSPSLSDVFTVAIQDEFVRVTGGELIVVNDYFYLVGGQNYKGAYAAGKTGDYTCAVRRFTLEQIGNIWTIANKDSVVDPVNLHRRDLNVVPFVNADGTTDAILYGGVFTSKDVSYNNPVYIKGLSQGNPSITLGQMEQKCNQYTCATVPMYYGQGQSMQYALLGGISYMMYNSDSAKLAIGDQIENHNIPMPFSNLVTVIKTDGLSSTETPQLPPAASFLPYYLGSNAAFFAMPQFAVKGLENVLNLQAVLSASSNNIKVGYMYGGILSDGPTSGTTPSGHVNTYANPVLYAVYMQPTQ